MTMKLTFVFLVVSGIVLLIKFSESKQSLMPQAIYQAIKQHYVKNSVKFEIFYNSNDVDVLEKTLKLIKELKDYRITKVNDEDTNRIYMQHSGIFMFDTVDNFNKLMNRLYFKRNGPEEVNMLIYCGDYTPQSRTLNIIVDEYQIWSYLLETNNEIVLKSFTFFTPGPKGCREYQLVDVNKFSGKSMKWSGTTFFLTMIRNFHGCPLYFAMDQDYLLNDGTIPNGELFIALASHLNFKVELVWTSDIWDTVNHKFDHDFRKIHQLNSYTYFDSCDLSAPLFSSPYVIAVPPGAPYSSIETFFLPFDLETWILFSLVFIFAFSVVIVVKLSRSRSLRIFVIGENISNPGLNIFGIFMGIGMMTLPRRSISRILLMNFILFSLIIRTAYQGKYFEFMTKEPNKRPIQTLAELIEKNYTLYFRDTIGYEDFKHTYADNLERLNYIEVATLKMKAMLLKELQDPNFKGCFLDLSTQFKKYEKENSSLKINVLEKQIDTVSCGICLRRRSFMSPIFRKRIEQLVTGGVWEKLESWEKHIKKIPEKRPKKPYDTVLTLKHLSIGFYIWLLMILLSSLAFAGEMLTYWGPKVARMLLFHYILSRFYKMQRSMH